MRVVELHISGYTNSWDSLNVRDYLVRYGSVLRIRADQRGFSFVTFDMNHSVNNLSQRIIAGNKKIVVGPPQRTENYQFGQIPPHGTITEMQIGFIR